MYLGPDPENTNPEASFEAVSMSSLALRSLHDDIEWGNYLEERLCRDFPLIGSTTVVCFRSVNG